MLPAKWIRQADSFRLATGGILHLMYKEQIRLMTKNEHLFVFTAFKRINFCYFNPYRLTDPFRR